MQALIDHVHADPVTPSSRLGRPLMKEIDRLVLDCLRKKPDDRPRDAAAPAASSELLERLSTVRFSEAWSNTHARAWWQAQMTELAGPLATP